MKKVLIIREGALGDLILTLPVVQSLKKEDFNVSVAGKGVYKNFFEKYSEIDKFYPFGSSFFLPIFSGEKTNQIKKFFNHFDIIIFYGREEEIAGKTLKEIFKKKIIFHTVEKDKLKVHITDYLLLPVEKILKNIVRTPVIKRKKEKEEMFVIHPGSGSKNKNYGKERFFEVVKKLKNEKLKVLLGPAEYDDFEWWKEKIGDGNIVKTESLEKVITLAGKTKIYLGNDSGITHLFAACEVKTIAIFGPTSPFIWSPRGKNVKVVFKEVGCNPCDELKMRKCKNKICFDRIKAADIINVIENLKGENGKTNHI